MQASSEGNFFASLKKHAKVHTFRFATAVLVWVSIGGAFYFRPEWITWALRTGAHGMESASTWIPYPWGDRIEIVLRELGGFIWFQITVLIILTRIVLSAIAIGWRYFCEKTR